MRAILKVILALIYVFSAFGAGASGPNIVLIVADDLGYCDCGLYGCDQVPTPNIERISDGGVLFTAGYVTSPVCSPSRASLLTGRYQQRFGHEFLPSDPSRGLPVGEETLGNAFKDAGYVTGAVGKWHLGVGNDFHPVNRGFDEFFGFTNSHSDYVDPTREDVRISFPGRKAPPATPWKGRGQYPIMRGNEVVEEDAYLTEAFTREAIAFIEDHKDEPFFLYLPHLAVHQPLQVTREYYDRFPHIEDESKRIYAAMTSSLDDGIGTVLDALESHGLDENTLVIFLSDNGAGVADYCSNLPLRMGKQTLFEGGVRVPFTMKWPAGIPEGVTYDHPVSALDIFPTALAAAGKAIVPNKQKNDGVNLLPYVNGSNDRPPHETLYWRSGANWAIRTGPWKLIHAGDRDWLYNLSEDIGEQTNLADKNPEVVRRLKQTFDQWNGELVDPAWPPIGAKGSPQFAVDGVEIKWPV
jgi:arylsulfatase A-like enzyme